MSMAPIRHFAAPITLGVLLAAAGFTYSLATHYSTAKRVAVIPPTCGLPQATFVSGGDSSAAAGVFPVAPPATPLETCFDLGSVVVNREFTRTINVMDGFPPYEFRIEARADNEPNNGDIDIIAAADGVSAKFVAATNNDTGAQLRASTPELQPPPALLDGSFLPQFKLVDIIITDQNPDPALATRKQTYCFTVLPVIEGDGNFSIIDLTNITGGIGVIDPALNGGNPVPPPIDNVTVLTASDGTSFNDLPTGLQSQAYEYQLHTNGGDIQEPDGVDEDEGEVVFGAFTGVLADPLDTENFPGAIQPAPSIYGGRVDGSYTFTAVDRDGDTAIDLEVSYTGTDPDEIASDQVFLDVMGVGGVPAARTLSIGSLGVQVSIQTRTDPDQLVHVGDVWTINVTGLKTPFNEVFSLHPDSPPLPDGLRLEESGLITGIPGRSGDYSFLVNVERFGPEGSANEELVLNRTTRQLFIRITGAPVNSNFVISSGGFRLNFGKQRRDSMSLHMFISKGTLRDFSQLKGASFNMIVGNDPETRVRLSSLTTAPLRFTKSGQLKYPPNIKTGNTAGQFISQPRVNVKAFADTGSLRISISRLDLSEAVQAAGAGVGGTLEVPMTVTISGGDGKLALNFDEIASFAYRTTGSSGRGQVIRGPGGATLNVGQFIIPDASGRITFDANQGGSDTLDMTLKGFLRLPQRLPIQSPLIPPTADVHILVGAQCVYEGDFSDFVLKGQKLILNNRDPGVSPLPLEQMIIDNRKGTFIMKLRSPGTNVATIQGATGGLIIDSTDPFNMNIRIRFLTDGGGPVIFDAQYALLLFRQGNTLSTR